VLVVDDDESIRSLSCEMLSKAGFEVETAEDGHEALELFNEAPERFDAVLLDMTMPGLDGEQTFRRLIEIRDDVPVIMSTGYSEQNAMDRFQGPQPAGFLQKPYRFVKLAETLNQVCGRG
jgi:DNA-binding NtrC family response regulator